MKNKPIKWIFGSGAQGCVTLDIWRSSYPGAEFRFIDDNINMRGKKLMGFQVYGGIEFLLENCGLSEEVIIAIGDNEVRLSIGKRLETRGLMLGNAVHISAVVSESAIIRGGCIISAQAVINTGVNLGKYVIVNSGAIVEHDSIIEDGAQLCAGISMGGRVIVEKGSFIGTGSVLAPRIKVGRESVVGAGSVVVNDLPPNVLAYGVPARVVKQLDKKIDWSRLL